MLRLTTELLRANASAHAASGDWACLRELLHQHAELAAADAQLAIHLAEAELRTGRPREARDWLTMVLPALEKAGDRRSRRTMLNLRGVAELEVGEFDEAEQTFARVIELARNDDDELLIARVLNNLGALADMRDRFDVAIAAYEHAIPLYQKLGDRRGLSETHHNLAISLRRSGQLQHAEDHERQAIGYASEARNATLEALGRLGLGEVALERGDALLAEAIAGHAAKKFAASNDALREADALRVLGSACLAQRKLSAARDALVQAYRLVTANGARLLEAEIRRLNANLLFATGREDEARQEAIDAARLFAELGSAAKAEEARRFAR